MDLIVSYVLLALASGHNRPAVVITEFYGAKAFEDCVANGQGMTVRETDPMTRLFTYPVRFHCQRISRSKP